jgi:transposase InsO family protein
LISSCRLIVGWSMATTLATQLVLDALNMALQGNRQGDLDDLMAGCTPPQPAGSHKGIMQRRAGTQACPHHVALDHTPGACWGWGATTWAQEL